ncbi:hypothetical protein [Aquimarina algiphila]|uniref:Uncharacterized protein n=1 Tax=Aquimarina algiphila TaxID=2047982 RepID=A0A554VPD1_9FLAO|nr:hypothetical protein [Aquimarina algiphila]TSE10339.1 hypothetical protein FOF46_04710 [Aquimarina algiphila]
MKTFNINLNINATDQNELEAKLQAFQDLQDHLDHEDFIAASEVIVEHPEIVEFIKEVIPEEGGELGMTDYIGIARKAFQRFAVA